MAKKRRGSIFSTPIVNPNAKPTNPAVGGSNSQSVNIFQSAPSIITQSGAVQQTFPKGKPTRETIDPFTINTTFVTNPQNNINLSLQLNNIVGGNNSLIASS